MGEGRMSIPQARVTQISQYEIPITRTSLKSFLGLVTFYAKFIPGLADHTTVLNGHLPKDNKIKTIITNQFRSAFDNIISAIVNHASLIIPKVSDHFCIFTDASTTVLTLEVLYVYIRIQFGSLAVSTAGNYYLGKEITQSLTWKH